MKKLFKKQLIYLKGGVAETAISGMVGAAKASLAASVSVTCSCLSSARPLARVRNPHFHHM